MRLVLALGLVGLMLACFAIMSAFEGRGRDVAESGGAGVVLLGAAAYLFFRVVLPRLRDRSRLELLEASQDRWNAKRERRTTAGPHLGE